MFKALALVGLFFGGGLFGIMKSLELKERTELLEDFLQMIFGVKSYINYFREPLIMIHNGKGENRHSKAFELFDNIRVELGRKNAEIIEIWAQKVDEMYRNTPLKSEDLELLKYPGTFIGQTDYDNQQAQFEHLEIRLRQKIDEAREDYNVKGTLYRRLGFFSGGLAAIIFI